MAESDTTQYILGISVDAIGQVGPVVAAFVYAAGSTVAYFIERRDKKRALERERLAQEQQNVALEQQRAAEASNKELFRQLMEGQENLEAMSKRLAEAIENPWPQLKEQLDRHIEVLEEQKNRLIQEKERLERQLRDLTGRIERLYQENRVGQSGIPGADDEAQVYRAQIDAILTKLDGIRSTIILANSVSKAYDEGDFDTDASKASMDAFFEQLEDQRRAVHGSVAAFENQTHIQRNRQRSIAQEKKARAAAEEKEKTEMRAENAYKQKKHLD